MYSILNCRQASNIIWTKFENLNAPHLVLQLSLCNPLNPGPRLNIKTVLSTYGDFHVKDKTSGLVVNYGISNTIVLEIHLYHSLPLRQRDGR